MEMSSDLRPSTGGAQKVIHLAARGSRGNRRGCHDLAQSGGCGQVAGVGELRGRAGRSGMFGLIPRNALAVGVAVDGIQVTLIFQLSIVTESDKTDIADVVN